jgi:hypothetical protein
MTQTRHPDLTPRSLPRTTASEYPDRVPGDNTDVRRLRVDETLWAAYTEIVGDGGRSADLKSYIEWRVDNPTTPLPGRRRGPVKRVRKSRTGETQ